MTDKIKHILAGLTVSFFVGVPAYVNDHALFSAIWVALWSGLFAAGIKEWCDMRTDGNKWDWWDFGCTCLGAVIVALFIIGLHFGRG
ncbi:MAG: hypothetical protein IIZ44_00555 [Muribaculaceae bacterium]|nr:hypothetical protein [Muribaculaceae bacterium]